MKKIYINHLLPKFIVFFITMISLSINILYDGSFNTINAVIVLFVSIYNVYYVKNNKLLLIIFICILYFNYSICYVEYFPNDINSFFISSDIYLLSKGINILLLFNSILCMFLPNRIHNRKIKSLFQHESPPLFIGIGLDCVLVLILLFAFGRPDSVGERGTPSAIYEYSILIFIIIFYFYYNNKIIRYISMMILIVFAIQNFAFGGRVTGIQLLMIYILFFHIDNLSYLKLILVIFIGIVSMSLIGAYRANIVHADINWSGFFSIMLKEGLANDTAYAAYYASLSFIYVKDILSTLQEFIMFFLFILSIVFGSKVNGSNLAAFTSQYYAHYGGGLLPLFFYFYLGIFGILIITLLLSLFLNRINNISEKSSGLMKCIAIYITGTVFRWYLYSPSNLFRGVLILSVLYFFMNNFLSNIHRNKSN